MKNNILKIVNCKLKIGDFRRGMTHSMFTQGHPEYSRGMIYVELIVVLSIFSMMTAVVLFNYGTFQGKVDIKNLASDIALKIVEAQKSALSGKLPIQATAPTWKPSYGIYIDKNSDNKSLLYFVDTNQDGNISDTNCSGSGECLEKITITKDNTISALNIFYQDTTSQSVNDISVSFSRPNSGSVIKSSQPLLPGISYVEITIASPKAPSAKIKVYTSGRIQVN